MQITQEQYEKIAKYLPTQRGNVSMTNLQLINAILYVTENWLQVESIAGNLWEMAYNLCSHEQVEQEWSSQQGICRLTDRRNHPN
jgi:hypothetical protein